MSRLVVQSADGNWVPGFVRDAPGRRNKLVEMSHLAVYFNVDSAPETMLSIRAPSPAVAAQQLRDAIASAERAPVPSYQYILQPAVARGRMVLARHHAVSPGVPLCDLDIQLDAIQLVVSERQLSSAGRIMEAFTLYTRRERFASDRPSGTIAGQAHVWWRFAIGRILAMVHERRRCVARRRRAPRCRLTHAPAASPGPIFANVATFASRTWPSTKCT